MKGLFICFLLITLTLTFGYIYQSTTIYKDEQVVNVFSARKEELVKSLFKNFTNKTGIKVNYIIDDAAQLLSRIENGCEADLFLAADAVNLILAKNKDLLSPVTSVLLDNTIPSKFKDSENYWFGLTKRTRILVYNKELINPQDLSTYEDLASDKWKGKILVRSSTSPYNRSLIAFMIANNGIDQTKQWVKGLVSNMARKPSGGDIDQINAVIAGEGGIAIVNSYYYARKLYESNDNNNLSKLGVFFPNQEHGGVMVNISGAGVVKGAKNAKNAVALIEYLASNQAQELYARENQEYPVTQDVKISDILVSWGEYLQSELPLDTLGKFLFQAVMIADECGWR